MHPRSNRDRRKAMRQDDALLRLDIERLPDVTREHFRVLFEIAHAFCITAGTIRSSMPARVPRKDRHVFALNCLNQFNPPPRVFVSAMKKKERFCRAACREPGTVEKSRAIPTLNELFGDLHGCGLSAATASRSSDAIAVMSARPLVCAKYWRGSPMISRTLCGRKIFSLRPNADVPSR